jgi:hypothetical protein
MDSRDLNVLYFNPFAKKVSAFLSGGESGWGRVEWLGGGGGGGGVAETV